MPLFIRDENVDAMVTEAMKLLGAKNKTELIRRVLKTTIDQAQKSQPLLMRVENARRLADGLGPVDPDFDQKKFSDELYGEG